MEEQQITAKHARGGSEGCNYGGMVVGGSGGGGGRGASWRSINAV